MATVRFREDRQTWEVRWTEPLVSVDKDGNTTKRWIDRRRPAPTKADAERLKREIEGLATRGERWSDKRKEAVTEMESLALAWIRAGKEANIRDSTLRHRSALLGTWIDWFGATRPVSELSLGLLEQYMHSLPSEGRQVATRHRKVIVVEQLWRWGWERRDIWPGVPEPRRLTGPAAQLPAPAQVVAAGAPTWADVDKMIAELLIPWHRVAALIMRYTGLRASQACGLRWSDVDLERHLLRVRSGVRGSKKGRTRVVPLHHALVAELRRWPAEGDLLFPRRYKDANGDPRAGAYRGDALILPFRRAWTAAHIPCERWDIPDTDEDELQRGKGSPTHAFRRTVRTELLRGGVEEAVVLHLVGQSAGHTAAAYVPETSPEQSPWWPRMLAAVDKIPAHKVVL